MGFARSPKARLDAVVPTYRLYSLIHPLFVVMPGRGRRGRSREETSGGWCELRTC